MTQIGIGVIGMGWMGGVHSRAYNQIPDRFHDQGIESRLIVCADADGARADAARSRFRFQRATADWHDVIADPEVDVVSITTPNDLHLEIIRAAAAAGKHILCEKPVGKTPEETLEAAEIAQRAGILTFVGFNYRWAPLVQYARRLIERGDLGEITHYRGRFLNGYARDARGYLTWRFDIGHGYGTLSDLMPHVLDMAHLIVGPIDAVVANRATFIPQRPVPTGLTVGNPLGAATDQTTMGTVTNEDYVGVLARFGNGAQGTLEACRVINGSAADMSFEVHGTRGAIKWSLERMNELQVQRRSDENPADEGYTTVLSGPWHPHHADFNPAWGLNLSYDDLKSIEIFEFLRSVASGTQSDPGFAAAAAVAREQQAVVTSWASDRWERVASPAR
ncbi:MAG: putative oxidoreductase [Chloroflexi bacterium]|jgi:predicted dehydrogenase|nr:putative oxidoreductase [Chloroflexota bacterium]